MGKDTRMALNLRLDNPVYNCEVELSGEWVKGKCHKLLGGKFIVLIMQSDLPQDVVSTLEVEFGEQFLCIEAMVNSDAPYFRLGKPKDE